MTTTQVVHTLVDVSQTPIPGVVAQFQLGGVGSNGVWAPCSGWLPDGSEAVEFVNANTDPTGQYTASLSPNALITPANTTYQVTHRVSGEKLYITVPQSSTPLQLSDLLTSQPAQLGSVVQGAMLSMVNNGDGTATVYAGGTASVTSNSDGTGTLTIGS